MIEIDGSDGEGGGQILRTSLALSMCTGQPFRLTNIRAKRSKPGLMRQHLACVLAARDVSDGEVDGAELGSMALTFRPGSIRAGAYAFPISGAGSTMLVLQTVLPALLKADAPSKLRLSGGTHNPMAPPVHFIERAFAADKRDARCECACRRRCSAHAAPLRFLPGGWWRSGGGNHADCRRVSAGKCG